MVLTTTSIYTSDACSHLELAQGEGHGNKVSITSEFLCHYLAFSASPYNRLLLKGRDSAQYSPQENPVMEIELSCVVKCYVGQEKLVCVWTNCAGEAERTAT